MDMNKFYFVAGASLLTSYLTIIVRIIFFEIDRLTTLRSFTLSFSIQG